jgi:hypothetical protein
MLNAVIHRVVMVNFVAPKQAQFVVPFTERKKKD